MRRMARGEIVVEAPELRLDPERMRESVDWNAIFGVAEDWAPDGPVEIERGPSV